MRFGRTELTIPLSEAKFRSGTPKGRKTQGKIQILPKKMSFRHFVPKFFKNFRPIFFFGRKIICWESFEPVFAEVSDRTELILGGKRSFKVWRTGFRYVRTGFKYRLVLRALNTA